MERLTDVGISEELGQLAKVLPAEGQSKMPLQYLDKVDGMISNIKSIMQMVMSAKQQAPAQSQSQTPLQIQAQPQYEKMENPQTMKEEKKAEIDIEKIKKFINSKLMLIKLIPKEYKEKTLTELMKLYKEDKTAETMLINNIVQMFDEVQK